MSLKMLKKAVTYSIIFAYTLNILTPAAHAMMDDEEQRFQAGLLKKVSANTSFARNEAERTLPTLRVDLTQKGESEELIAKVDDGSWSDTSQAMISQPSENVPAKMTFGNIFRNN